MSLKEALGPLLSFYEHLFLLNVRTQISIELSLLNGISEKQKLKYIICCLWCENYRNVIHHIEKVKGSQGRNHTPSTLRKLRHEDCEFQTNPGCSVKPWYKTKKGGGGRGGEKGQIQMQIYRLGPGGSAGESTYHCFWLPTRIRW